MNKGLLRRRGIIFGALLFLAMIPNSALGLEGNTVPYKALGDKEREEFESLNQTIHKTIMKNDMEEAMRLVNFAIRKFSDQPELLGTRAELFEAKNEFKSAIGVYNRILSHNQLDGNVLLKRATLRLKLNETDSALADLNACLSSPFRPVFTASEALKMRSQIERTRGNIAQADQDETDSVYLHHRMFICVPELLEKQQPPFVARTENAKAVIEKLTALAQKGPDFSVDYAENFLGIIPKTEVFDNTLKALIVRAGATKEWSDVTLTAVPDGSKVNSIHLTLNPLYAELLPADVRKLLGEPIPRTDYSPHGSKELLEYRTQAYELTFASNESQTSFVNGIRVRWPTPDENQRRLTGEQARANREASVGTRKDEVIDWLQRLMKHRTKATAADINSILKTEFVKSKSGNDYIDKSAPQEMLSAFASRDYSVQYQPDGTLVSLVQLEIRPGDFSHRIMVKQIVERLGEGTIIDGSTMTPRQNGQKIRSYKFDGGSMRVVSPDFARDQVLIIDFWWKTPGSSAETLEQQESQVTVESVIAEAKALMAKRQFPSALQLLFKAGQRRPAKHNSNQDLEEYEKGLQLRAAYSEFYRLQKKDDIVQYIAHVPCIQLVLDISHLESQMIDRLPTIPEYRKGHWNVTCNEHACFIRRNEIPPMDVQDGPLLKRCQELFGISPDEKEVVDIPADLLDAIYYHLPAL